MSVGREGKEDKQMGQGGQGAGRWHAFGAAGTYCGLVVQCAVQRGVQGRSGEGPCGILAYPCLLPRRAHAGEWPGPFVEEETNEVVGYHKGFWFHTVGQRKGVPLSGGPW